MTIVCATHFTASSSDAVVVAAHLARRTGERLCLATVLPGGLASGGPRAQAVSEALERESRTLRALGVEVEVALLQGKVEEALWRLCRDVGARLLLVGDRRRTTFLSRPVERIANGVPVPLLVVRGLEPLQAWTKGQRPLTVLLGTDSTTSPTVAREWLAWLAAAGPLDVLVTQVWDPAEEHGVTAPLRARDLEGLAEIRRQNLRTSLVGLPAQVTSRIHLEVGRSAGELLPRIAARERVDLMVLGTHPKKGLLARNASVAHEVIQRAPMCVALLPTPQAESAERLTRFAHPTPRHAGAAARRGDALIQTTARAISSMEVRATTVWNRRWRHLWATVTATGP